MAAKKQIIDTNVLVRFFTGEPPAMAAKARRLVERADEGELLLVILPVILAETVYTLESFYEMKREDVAASLLSFVQSRGIEMIELSRVMHALTLCRDKRNHFSDAYLAAAALEMQEPIASFDRDFDKFEGVERIEPKA